MTNVIEHDLGYFEQSKILVFMEQNFNILFTTHSFKKQNKCFVETSDKSTCSKLSDVQLSFSNKNIFENLIFASYLEN